ncbi:MAG: FAD:protein FMN transferase [Tannerella sp.]|jgi:thiamine biosynthesis lipoprotein|nr:FAD:protein FMN transferase [Tannerella sp.]
MIYTNYYPSSQLFHGAAPRLMGTRLDALLFGVERERMEMVWRQMIAEIGRLERMMSRFDTEAILFRLNRDAALFPADVPEELWDVLQECKQYHERTDGYFDIAQGCFGGVEFDDARRTVFLPEGATLDLGACGKGYALRAVRRLLEAEGVQRALVNFGDSSALATGAHPHGDGDGWPVGICDPYTQKQRGVICLRNDALSVSGNAPSRPAHIIRPAAGACVTGRKMTVAVADDPVEAEALTTALMAAGEEDVERIAVRFSVKEYGIYE